MFVLAHLSDPHLAPLPAVNPLDLLSKRGLGFINWLRKRRAIHRPEVIAAIVADLKAQAPDHIAVTGDLVNLSLDEEFIRARRWLESLGPPADVTLVPGNHDAYVSGVANRAREAWGDFMRGDGGESFPFVRRRGPIALIGLSTSVPTLPLAATGRLGAEQLARFGDVLAKLKDEALFRVVLIHHPPTTGAHHFRRLVDAKEFRDVLRRHGADLILHGHHHASELVWLTGPKYAVPCVGVPSASGAPGHGEENAGYKLFEIEGEPGAWLCTMISRGLSDDGLRVDEIGRQVLG